LKISPLFNSRNHIGGISRGFLGRFFPPLQQRQRK
jgi:hypothetical protein